MRASRKAESTGCKQQLGCYWVVVECVCSVDTNQSTGTEAKPGVVATSTVINDWVEQVGGEEIQLRRNPRLRTSAKR